MRQAGDSSLEALLQAARAEFGRSLAEKMAELEAMIAQGEWQGARRAAHKLCGSAGIYGFGALGCAAAALEEILIASESDPDVGARANIRAKLDEMYTEANRAALETR
jgi:HPt (histidine-containing phosphotransfer) domain-containing protein